MAMTGLGTAAEGAAYWAAPGLAGIYQHRLSTGVPRETVFGLT